MVGSIKPPHVPTRDLTGVNLIYVIRVHAIARRARLDDVIEQRRNPDHASQVITPGMSRGTRRGFYVLIPVQYNLMYWLRYSFALTLHIRVTKLTVPGFILGHFWVTLHSPQMPLKSKQYVDYQYKSTRC